MSKLILPPGVKRAKTRDMMTYDASNGFRTIDAQGNMMGRQLPYAVPTHDGRTVDSTGAFLVGELERLDPTLHLPLASVTWGRDIDLREDVTIADEISSFTLSTYGTTGGLGAGNGIRNGKSWIGKATDQVTNTSVDIGKTPFPLTPWGQELKFSILELESAAKLGRPIDQQKFEGLQLKHQMDIDEMVYVGDASINQGGLVYGNSLVTNVNNVVNGASGFPQWTKKTPQEILADVNTALTSVWQASAWAVLPNRILIPPAQFGYIATTNVSTAGNQSILRYLLDNNLLTKQGRGTLEIFPLKWLIGAGVGGTLGTSGTVDRMAVYTKDKQRVRYPMTLLQRTPVQFDSIYHKTTYFCRLGVTEVVYPETIGYFDGI